MIIIKTKKTKKQKPIFQDFKQKYARVKTRAFFVFKQKIVQHNGTRANFWLKSDGKT